MKAAHSLCTATVSAIDTRIKEGVAETTVRN